ncbi:uncharacterized protein DUF1801 [Herbihabitans rhizosphaerae]|uniref:Uncharacterized protein DUF1801 n=1 Tax=Herbihabitans rhizosphaerae TaxID=1872711 RepID=A0A4Q7KT50_9PSEU|nr:DUF1801 domain-containing protein [Herbihabitans rhizosphaerae]RZS38971.1 uncharacterized protein DUF1801 [Herbihabitans rhizosphaerae]
MDTAVAKLLERQEPPVRALAESLYDKLNRAFSGAVITCDDQGFGFGTDTGYKGLVFSAMPHRAHVNLGFNRGAELPDPAGLLEGTGKVHRHYKVRTVADLDRPELDELIIAALTKAGVR